MAPPTAAQLKEEGNALFVEKDFARAYEKYTEAIAVDGQNAVLYANRCACGYGMGKYLDALRDAYKATEIDPKYAKGWSRLATAYEAALDFKSAAKAWQKALDVLPKTDPSPAELKQKEQYTASLKKAKEHLVVYLSGLQPVIVANELREKLPWAAAADMLPELYAARVATCSTSAYVIYHANQEFTQGVQYLKMLKKIPVRDSPDGFGMFGHTNGLACITNGIMRDMRVFRRDCNDWVDKFNNQVLFEVQKYNAWNLEDVETIQQQALERLKKEGWDKVRPALAVAVRSWLMIGFFDAQLRQAPHVAAERLKEILELLHWGRQVWRDVPTSDRGVIFQDTFVRGVKGVYLEILVEAFVKASGDDKKVFLNTTLNMAREIIEEAERFLPPNEPPSSEPVDPGFNASFYIYPVAHAYASIGYCFNELAQSIVSPAEQKTYYLSVIKQYTQAARVLPQDDEKYCWYLHRTLDPMLRTGASKDAIMSVVKAIRVAMPKMQRIWTHSAMGKQGRDATLETVLCIAEQNCR